ncbi:MAG: PKD domain-containing protein [Candidatus Gracilibacteria bacterium]|nr:PKD domain-containing protein [Candidatus Gracilibacteria bacterium]
MKRLFLAFAGGLLLTSLVMAQSPDSPSVPEATILPAASPDRAAESVSPEKEPLRIRPQAEYDEFIAPGQETVFDAMSSELLSEEEFGPPVYWWDFGDGSQVQWGGKVRHTFADPGRYEVKLSVRQGQLRESRIFSVKVYSQKMVLVRDSEVPVEGLIERAGDRGIWLRTLSFQKSETGIAADETFQRRLQENVGFLQEAEMILFYTRSATAFQNFAQWWQKISPESQISFRQKQLVQISEGSLDQIAKLLQPVFVILDPGSILLTRPEALDLLFQNPTETITDDLQERAIEFKILDARMSTWLPLSRLTTYFVSHGISQNVIFLLLAVPFVTFVIAFFRQFVGLRTFGVFAPLMLTLSFILLGLEFGFLVFALVLVVSYLIRLLFDHVELLYIPRVSLLLSVLALSFFLVLGLALYFDTSINLTLAIFPMLVMSTISEKFLSAQTEGGLRTALIVAGETVLVSLIGFVFVEWNWMETRILSVPEIILLPILATVWLGRFTGLRLSEYFKFSALFGDDTKEE